MNGQISINDMAEVRLNLKSYSGVEVIKWNVADYLAAKEKQDAQEKETERQKKWKELSTSFEQYSANFERLKNIGNLDSAIEESFNIARLFPEMASKFVMDGTKYKATYEAVMKYCVASANQYYQEGKNADFERIYLRVLNDKLPVENEMENDVLAYGKRLLTQNEESFLGFYKQVEQKTTPPEGLKHLSFITYAKRGDECRSRNDLKGAIEYYTLAQKAGGKVGLKMAKVFYQNGEIEKAIDNFDTVMVSPDYNEETKAEAKQQLSKIYTEKAKKDIQNGYTDKAVQNLEKALYYDTNNSEAHDLKIKADKQLAKEQKKIKSSGGGFKKSITGNPVVDLVILVGIVVAAILLKS
jgi:hypothetical protein